MTEGIIQKVFRDFMDRNNYDIHDMVLHFPELQQELIEEIKKSHNNGGCDITCGNTKDCRFIEELIGDIK
jgi:hypothetical protein